LLKDYEAGIITDEQVNECASRVLDLAYRCKSMQEGKSVKRSVEERLNVARGIAEESIVLLKNEDGLLPLKKGSRVALSGCYAQPERKMLAGDGSSHVVSLTEKHNLTELLKAELGCDVPFETMYYYDKALGTNGYAEYAAKPFKGKRNAALADVSIICAGTGAPFEYESFDRPTMRLPVAQERAILDLASVNPNTVVVLFAGSAIDVGAWADKVKAIVYAGFCGERGLEALCSVLCGKANPSGKLSETFPVCFEATPVADGYIDTAVTRYAEGLDVGYRYYDRHPQNIAFPFGFGLSYSTFEYSGLKIEAKGLDVTVGFNVKNSSAIDGKEVAQLYVAELVPVAYRPLKELKGFVKTEIKAGKTAKIEMSLNSRAFAYYSTAD
ncbi:MAG: glycoside hydrolase family 3 C-terminal domain-containing protein, partial [Clostridiales bacterium]|nr:glycoside hydrolase family 3 C-terminal domain-containing protein [Clostridiales bacterium]